MPQYGYAGSILKVDLTTGRAERLPTADYAGRFVGGRGLACSLYWEMVPAGVKAFDPDNCLIFASGPLAGFPGFAGGRFNVCGKSPLGRPESFTYANLGEGWGIMLKYAGYAALVVRGAAQRPSCLYIHDDGVEIRDATHLRGKSTFDTIDTLKAELGRDVNVLAIGPAGENHLPFAVIIGDGDASGSGGLGAVMGAKNLKAIAVRGKNRPQAAHPERLEELAAAIRNARPKGGIPQMWGVKGLTHFHACYGCGIGCSREMYELGGRRYKALCQSSNMYEAFSVKYEGRRDGSQFLATRLCDGYG
ncbi:MAG: hypothetical protein N2506_07675, partial [Dehalococcoidales bacterium]|nr:hypothetical protein [Dehalococcoidales bacterium]